MNMCFLLRCPAETSPDEAGLFLADRCHSLASFLPPRRQSARSPSPKVGPISPDSVNNMLKRVLARAGIPKVRFHDLRHTFATIALQNGVDIKTVSGMLGHFSAGFTLDTYAHVTTAAQKEAADTMGNVLNV